MAADDCLTIDVDAGRRAFIGALGLGVAGATLLGGGAIAQALTDMDIMNFTLNFEYLGAQFYSYATTGSGIPTSLLSGTGTRGRVTGGAQPEISLGPAFAAAAQAAGIPGAFDVFADDTSFLLGAFVLEDVCVTALHGAAPLLQSPANLDAAAGLLGVEAYQAGMIRVKLYELASAGQTVSFTNTQLISNLRTTLSDNANPPDAQPIQVTGMANIVPADANSIAFARTPREVLNIAYGAQDASQGQFFPNGVNGTIR